ncbi:hypothetical protein D9757_006102 [Collybiopsis confluens]|uniref:Uncharacterized protein n=1 Tax=Collybiopsis confluens TaxID=2823264 RepID=A0A8H5HHH6_9AGAR|nr:hypothetical protein D9757_006102 [Collybiopsis confluens]
MAGSPGTGIQLIGYTTDASYRILVDGIPQAPTSSPTVLASILNLDNTAHEISLTTIISNSSPNQTQSFIVFDKAVIFAPPTSLNSSSIFVRQSLNDSDVSFRGPWHLQTNITIPARSSTTVNDSASAEFNGTAFQIFGTVSPEGGNYTVQLDNSTAQFSAQASFTQENTLLFTASALDPNMPHSVRVVNNGGTLILPLGGFQTFSSGDPNLAPPSQTSTIPSATASVSPGGDLSKAGLAKGTIAALVLAGVLAFLLISGLLFCVFVWRPMKIRQRQARRERRMVQREGSGSGREDVLDIGHNDPGYLDPSPANSAGTRNTRGSQKSNGRSGFHRWKEDLESANGGKVLGALGLVFRHSDSPEDKQSALDDDLGMYGEELRSTKSSSLSSGGGSAQSKKGKGKSRWRRSKKSTHSPSYTIDLPPLSRSREQLESEDVASSSIHRSFSGLTSLTYMSTPNTENSRELSFNAPASQRSNPSPRISTSPNHQRTDSSGILLVPSRFDSHSRSDGASEVDYHSSVVSTHQETDPQVAVHEYEVQSTHPSSRSANDSRGAASLYAREMDRGSVRTYDDGVSVLGPATARAAIRSLSPRTSELIFANSSLDMLVKTVVPQDDGKLPRERLLNDETTHSDNSPDTRARSPYRVEPTKRTSLSASRKSVGLSVRFEDEEHDSLSSDNRKKAKGKEPVRSMDRTLLTPAGLSTGPKATFRLTPQLSIISPISEADSNLTTSFLDLSSSNSNSDSSHRDPSVASQRVTNLKSRWSATTAATGTDPDSHNLGQGSSESPESRVSASPPSSNFPFPVSLPASPHHPEGFKPSPPTSPLWEAASHAAPGQLHTLHPFGVTSNPASPSDSVPMSISDLHFRHSDSENEEVMTATAALGTGGSHLPPHPPLPNSVPPTPTFPPTPSRIATSPSSPGFPNEPLSTPSYIVSRVFPRGRSGSGVDALSPPAHRTFGSS